MSYTEIADSEIEPEAPLTSVLMAKIRDNLDFLNVVPIKGMQVLTSSGTYTPSNRTTKALVFVTGGGGSGGKGDSGGSFYTAGDGGAAVTAVALVDISGTVSVTVGAGGASQTTNNAAGNAGGQSAFGSVSANGGNGGIATDTATAAPGAPQTTTANATLAIPGGGGFGRASQGGASFWGSGGIGAAVAGVAWGSGGTAGNTASNSAAGKQGVVVVIEF